MLNLSLRRLSPLRAAVFAIVAVSAAVAASGNSTSTPAVHATELMFVAPYQVSHVQNYVNPQQGAQQGAIAGQARSFKLFGEFFPVVGFWLYGSPGPEDDIWVPPPPLKVEIELPDHNRVTVGASHKSSSELHFELPAHLAIQPQVYLRVVSDATEFWHPSVGTGSATLQVKRSSSDTQCDNDVDAADAFRVLEILAGLDHAEPETICSHDANKNGALEVGDAVHVRKEVAGLVPHPLFSFTP